MKRTEWFKRIFPVIEDNGVLPSIIERLYGTPARLEEMTANLDPALLIKRPTDRWTIKEEIGHLSDLEPLWLGRLDDLINGSPELTVADLTNQTTHTANHDGTDLKILLQRFRYHRQKLVSGLLGLEDQQLLNASLHPRLRTPMRIVDLAYFVAEHDDHHLAAIREITLLT
jgi:uncharacterized damage-inducible protein DinB